MVMCNKIQWQYKHQVIDCRLHALRFDITLQGMNLLPPTTSALAVKAAHTP
jgi:hypothetical protein